MQKLFGFAHPTYGHVPLLLSSDGRRLSKRDKDLDLGVLRSNCTPEKLLGVLAHSAELIDKPVPISAVELATEFSWNKLRKDSIFLQTHHLI